MQPTLSPLFELALTRLLVAGFGDGYGQRLLDEMNAH